MSDALEVVLYTEGPPFSGDSLERGPLGGSETAFVSVARELACLGHRVTALCRCPRPGAFDGVAWRDASEVERWCERPCDLFLCSRFWHVLRLPLRARAALLWLHDVLMPDQAGPLAALLPRIDALFCLSDYHRSLLLELVPQAAPIVATTTNGLDLELVAEAVAKAAGKRHRIMYTSRPERGLEPALELYERLGDRSLELLTCSYPMVVDERVRAYEARCLERIEDLRRRGFPVSAGSFAKRELYRELAASKAVVYPTDYPEISCISALEAQACGTVFLTTDDFALRESVGYERLPSGDLEAFLERLGQVLEDDELRCSLEERGRRHVAGLSWRRVAESFLARARAELEAAEEASRSPIRRFDRVGPRPRPAVDSAVVRTWGARPPPPAVSGLAERRDSAVGRLEEASEPADRPAALVASDAAPTVSCLTATRGRLRLLKRSIRCYCRQTYPRRELVIVTDGEERERRAIEEYLAELSRDDVRAVFLDGDGWTLGRVRNAALEAATGEIVCQWDDDDLSHPERLEVQVRRLLEEKAQACLFTEQLQLLEAERALAWVDWTGGGRVEGIWRLIPGSLMMHRDERFRYPESGPTASRGEDSALLARLAGAVPLAELGGCGHLIVYTYHGRNTFPRQHHREHWQRSLPPEELLRRQGVLRAAVEHYSLPRPLTVYSRDQPVLVL